MSYMHTYPYTAGNAESGDDEEMQGRILSVYEYNEILRSRSDIFVVDNDVFLKKTELCCCIIAGIIGLLLFNAEQTMRVATDMIDPYALAGSREQGVIRILKDPVQLTREIPPKVVDRPVRLAPRQPTAGATTRSVDGRTGGGNYAARIMKKGVLGHLSNFVFGRDVHGDLFGKGGRPADNMDAFLVGKNRIGKGSSSAAGRMGPAVIGFGNGISGGFGGGNEGGSGDIEGLMSADYVALQIKEPGREGGRRLTVDMQPNTTIRIGGRNKNSISRVVQQNLVSLRYAYNMRLREKPGLKGKVTIRFAIDEFGRVIFCEVVGSTMYDRDFENSVVSKIKTWVFDKIDMPGDVTEVEYPFVFSM